MTVVEKLRAAQRLFSLSRKELCSILGVTRETLYGWLEGREEPSPEMSRKIGKLHHVVEGLDEPLFRGYVDEALPGYPFSILYCLLVGDFNDMGEPMENKVRLAARLTRERAERIAEHRANVHELSEAEKDLILEDNLNQL